MRITVAFLINNILARELVSTKLTIWIIIRGDGLVIPNSLPYALETLGLEF